MFDDLPYAAMQGMDDMFMWLDKHWYRWAGAIALIVGITAVLILSGLL